MLEKNINENFKNKEQRSIPVLYFKDVSKKIKENPHELFIIAMRGPQGSGKDTVALSLINEAQWGIDQIISADELSYLEENELLTISNLLKKTGTRENAINQTENFSKLSTEEKQFLYKYRKDILSELLERMKYLKNYHWTEEKRDWASLYVRTMSQIYLENNKSVIANTMHVYAYSLKPYLNVSDKFKTEFLTLFPEKTQERIRNGKKEVIQIHDGEQWFSENFEYDNNHNVNPEKVKKFSSEFEWSLTRKKIEEAVKPY